MVRWCTFENAEEIHRVVNIFGAFVSTANWTETLIRDCEIEDSSN